MQVNEKETFLVYHTIYKKKNYTYLIIIKNERVVCI